MESSKLRDAWILAKKFQSWLKIEKPLQIVLGREEFTEVRVIRQGKLIPEDEEKTAILKNEYDIVRITLHGQIPMLNSLPEWLQKENFIETIFHELLHVKHPDWDEEKIRDFSAAFMGKLVEMKEKEK